jgi:hypothetical protein
MMLCIQPQRQKHTTGLAAKNQNIGNAIQSIIQPQMQMPHSTTATTTTTTTTT